MHYFATQLHAEQQTTHSLRASQYARKRKHGRRGGHDDDDNDDENDDDDQNDDDNHDNNPDLLPSSATPKLAQLHVAGLLPQEEYEVPPFPFPHAPARADKGHHGSRKIQKEIAGPPSRLYAVNSPLKPVSTSRQSESTTLKLTHLNLLSTVMHRCLLEGDYQRAGRAWGMILRTEVSGGRPIEVRNHDRWGIGAEILLRRRRPIDDDQSSNNQPTSGQSSNNQPTGGQSSGGQSSGGQSSDGQPTNGQSSNNQPSNSQPSSIYSEAGFELAREYYERLIVQYPHRQAPRNAADAKTFYPAMFSLWIAEVCEKSKRTRQRLQQESRARSMSVDSVMGSYDNDDNDNPIITRAHEDEIQVAELAHATEIASRLDDLTASPPFDKQASLLQIRGNVALWISDLITGNSEPDEDWSMDDDGDDSIPLYNEQDSSELFTRLTKARREVLHAQTLFQRAEANGSVRKAGTMVSIDARLLELARRIAKLPTF